MSTYVAFLEVTRLKTAAKINFNSERENWRKAFLNKWGRFFKPTTNWLWLRAVTNRVLMALQETFWLFHCCGYNVLKLCRRYYWNEGKKSIKKELAPYHILIEDRTDCAWCQVNEILFFIGISPISHFYFSICPIFSISLIKILL